MADSLWPHGLQPTRLLCPWDSPDKNTTVGCHALFQGIFPTQGSNPGYPQCRWIVYCLSHQGSPRILEWVAYLFSRGSSPPSNQTVVSCIAGGFFTSWATREAPILYIYEWLTKDLKVKCLLGWWFDGWVKQEWLDRIARKEKLK